MWSSTADEPSPQVQGGRRERHGLGNVYPNLLHLEATLRLLEECPDIAIPRDNRLLVERALHPQALAVIQQQGGAAWINHGNMLTASRATSAWALRRDGRARPMESDVDRP